MIFRSRKSQQSSFLALLATAALLQVSQIAAVSGALRPGCLEPTLIELRKPEGIPSDAERLRASRLLTARKNNVTFPLIPSVEQLSIVQHPTIPGWDKKRSFSAGLSDPLLERARELKVFDDFKYLSDLAPKEDRTLSELIKIGKKMVYSSENTLPIEGEKSLLKKYIETNYKSPDELIAVDSLAPRRWSLEHPDSKIRDAFDYTEKTWTKLLREPRPAEGGSLLPSPYPVLIPAGRFQESYYWDTYFGNLGLLATGRLDIAQMQVENFLGSIRRYGFVPNGGRVYYLSRSQPPFISSMVRDVYEASVAKASTSAEKIQLARWLRERAYPLIKADYNSFWMNPKTRYDKRTGLNHHWDDINLPRPERHGTDNELALGKTFRDVRAAAESGLDFTDAFQNEASRVAGPLLNSMLYKTETDLVWAARELRLEGDAKNFEAAAKRRQTAVDRYLWNDKRGHYQSLLLDTGRPVNALSADTFAPLFAGLASKKQAARVRSTLTTLEKPGGIMASNLLSSTHQWDGVNGWAPYQVMAIKGLNRYGYSVDGRRIAEKWTNAIAKIYFKNKTFYERLDVAEVKKPEIDSNKYPTQEGFLWTNGAYVWTLVDALDGKISLLKTQ